MKTDERRSEEVRKVGGGVGEVRERKRSRGEAREEEVEETLSREEGGDRKGRRR